MPAVTITNVATTIITTTRIDADAGVHSAPAPSRYNEWNGGQSKQPSPLPPSPYLPISLPPSLPPSLMVMMVDDHGSGHQ